MTRKAENAQPRRSALESGRKLLAATRAASAQDVAATHCGSAGAETVATCTHEVAGLESALHRCALFCLIESESPVLLRAKGLKQERADTLRRMRRQALLCKRERNCPNLIANLPAPVPKSHPPRPRKKARSLPTGPESFGRGCLKGHFHMQLPCPLRKCEMSQSGCSFCIHQRRGPRNAGKFKQSRPLIPIPWHRHSKMRYRY